MKVISVVGARPQFVKLAPLSKALRKDHEEIILHTGQHFDEEMSELFFRDLEISIPKYNLELSGGTHAAQTGKMLAEIEKVFFFERPNLVIVFGDTNSTLAASLAASKLGICTIHVESGLRSFNKSMPEEINRIVSDHIADYLFVPTMLAIKNLEKEGLLGKSFLTGDIMVDSLEMAMRFSKKSSVLKQFNNYYLLTLHRPYNVDNPEKLKKILINLGELNQQVLFPVHPRTKNIMNKNNIRINDNIILLKPVGYLDFVNMQVNANKVITDSGGIQKEAYILKKPCITLRSETEWVETVESGWNLLLDFENETRLKEKIEEFRPPNDHPQIFGEKVTEKMVEIINQII